MDVLNGCYVAGPLHFFVYDLRGKTCFIILGTLHSSIDAYLEVQNPGLHDAMHSLSSCI